MEHEISFPNPIERMDLPRRRRRWPKVLLALFLLGILMLALLPQILQTGLGRSALGHYIGARCHMKVWVQGLKTSWFGKTTTTGVWISDDTGQPRLGWASLESDLSLWHAIRGEYHLGNAKINGLLVNYVVDYGNGLDLLDKFAGRTASAAIPAATTLGGAAPNATLDLPDLTGRLALTNATIHITRGQIDAGHGFRTNFQSATFSGVDGTIDIEALDKPWSCTLNGFIVGKKPDDPTGTCSLSGTADLGNDGKRSLRDATLDLKLQVTQVSPDALLWAIWPGLESRDYAQIFGPSLSRFAASIQLGQGRLLLTDIDITSDPATGGHGSIRGAVGFDLTAAPAVLTVAEGGLKIQGCLSAGLAQRYFSYVNPFLFDTPGGGDFILDVHKATTSLRRRPQDMSVDAELAVQATPLNPGLDWTGEDLPPSLTGQWEVYCGNVSASPAFTLPRTRFTVADRQVRSPKTECTIGETAAELQGVVGLDSRMAFSAKFALAPEIRSVLTGTPYALVTTIDGKLETPHLTPSPAPDDAFNTLIGHNIERLHALRLERIRRQTEREIDENARRIQQLTGSPSTQP